MNARKVLSDQKTWPPAPGRWLGNNSRSIAELYAIVHRKLNRHI